MTQDDGVDNEICTVTCPDQQGPRGSCSQFSSSGLCAHCHATPTWVHQWQRMQILVRCWKCWDMPKPSTCTLHCLYGHQPAFIQQLTLLLRFSIPFRIKFKFTWTWYSCLHPGKLAFILCYFRIVLLGQDALTVALLLDKGPAAQQQQPATPPNTSSVLLECVEEQFRVLSAKEQPWKRGEARQNHRAQNLSPTAACSSQSWATCLVFPEGHSSVGTDLVTKHVFCLCSSFPHLTYCHDLSSPPSLTGILKQNSLGIHDVLNHIRL